MTAPPSAAEIIRKLALKPHPEGGHYRETFRDAPANGSRGAMTAIYYLLAAGEESAWHKVDATEIWHYYAGARLSLSISDNGRDARVVTMGGDVVAGQQPQAIVPVNAWQSARSLGAWTLVGCTVGPAFAFSGFAMAPKGWQPGSAAANGKR